MIIDYTPETLPRQVRAKLAHYGNDAFVFRLRDDGEPTLRAVNRYKGQLRMQESQCQHSRVELTRQLRVPHDAAVSHP
jgi:hypothetical protein